MGDDEETAKTNPQENDHRQALVSSDQANCFSLYVHGLWETVTSRRAYKYEEDGRGPGRWGSVAPNRLGSETVFPFAHAGENLLGSHSLLIWMVGRQTLRWDYFTFARDPPKIALSVTTVSEKHLLPPVMNLRDNSVM